MKSTILVKCSCLVLLVLFNVSLGDTAKEHKHKGKNKTGHHRLHLKTHDIHKHDTHEVFKNSTHTVHTNTSTTYLVQNQQNETISLPPGMNITNITYTNFSALSPEFKSLVLNSTNGMKGIPHRIVKVVKVIRRIERGHTKNTGTSLHKKPAVQKYVKSSIKNSSQSAKRLLSEKPKNPKLVKSTKIFLPESKNKPSNDEHKQIQQDKRTKRNGNVTTQNKLSTKTSSKLTKPQPNNSIPKIVSVTPTYSKLSIPSPKTSFTTPTKTKSIVLPILPSSTSISLKSTSTLRPILNTKSSVPSSTSTLPSSPSSFPTQSSKDTLSWSSHIVAFNNNNICTEYPNQCKDNADLLKMDRAYEGYTNPNTGKVSSTWSGNTAYGSFAKNHGKLSGLLASDQFRQTYGNKSGDIPRYIPLHPIMFPWGGYGTQNYQEEHPRRVEFSNQLFRNSKAVQPYWITRAENMFPAEPSKNPLKSWTNGYSDLRFDNYRTGPNGQSKKYLLHLYPQLHHRRDVALVFSRQDNDLGTNPTTINTFVNRHPAKYPFSPYPDLDKLNPSYVKSSSLHPHNYNSYLHGLHNHFPKSLTCNGQSVHRQTKDQNIQLRLFLFKRPPTKRYTTFYLEKPQPLPHDSPYPLRIDNSYRNRYDETPHPPFSGSQHSYNSFNLINPQTPYHIQYDVSRDREFEKREVESSNYYGRDTLPIGPFALYNRDNNNRYPA